MNKHTGHKSGGRSHPGHKKVFDVVRPGKVMAPPNSRSVIVGHKPPVADDQFVPASPVLDEHSSTTAPLLAANPDEKHSLLSHSDPELHPPADVPQMAVSSSAVPADTKSVTEMSPVITAPQPLVSPETNAPTPLHAAIDPDLAEVARDLGGSPADVSQTPTTPAVMQHPAPAAAPANMDSHLADNPTPQHLAVEQVVSDPIEGSAQHMANNTQNATAQESQNMHGPLTSSKYSPKTIDQLLAETGAPDLRLDNPPPQKTIISHHQPRHSGWRWVVIVIVLFVLAAVVADVLLDGGIWMPTMHIPHTHFF